MKIKQVLDAANDEWAKRNYNATECIIRACELHGVTFKLKNGFGCGTVAMGGGKIFNVQYDAMCWMLA
jgi:hypothetical protein